MNVNIVTAVVPVIVGRYHALMSAEMFSCKLHTERLCFFQRQASLCISRIEREDEVVAFDVTGFPVLFVLPVGDLTVEVI